MKEYINLGEFNQIRNLLRSWQDCTEKTIKAGGVEYTIAGWCSPYDSHTLVKVETTLLKKGVWLSNRRGSIYFSFSPVNIKDPKPGLAKPREDVIPTAWLHSTLEKGGGVFLPPLKFKCENQLVYLYWADRFDGFDEDGNLKPFLPGRLAYEIDATTDFSVTITVEEEVENDG